MLAGAIVAGVMFGLYFTLVGLGLNLVFGVMRIVNLAHGDFLMLGGFATWWLFTAYGLHPLVSAVLVLVVFIGVGLPIYYLVVPRLLRAKDSEMLSLILFFGMSQMIEAIATIILGTTERSLPGRMLGVGPVHHLWHAPAETLGLQRGRQRHRRAAGVSLSVPHEARHADPCGDGQP